MCKVWCPSSFDPAQIGPCLTVMSTLSRSWSSIDETNFSDLIAEFSKDKCLCLAKKTLDRAAVVAFWNVLKGVSFSLTGMLPHKTKRGQAALERLKVFDGIPPPYDKVINVKTKAAYRFCLTLAFSFNSAVCDAIQLHPYKPLLSNDFENKYCLRHAVLLMLRFAVLFSSVTDFGFCSTEEAHGCSSCS